MRSPRDIQRWYPERWSQVAGNCWMIAAWLNFITHGGCNMLFTGANRTGKTRTNALGFKALLCTNRTGSNDPCGGCATCLAVDEARDSHTGLFSAATGSRYSFVPIDCHQVSKDQLLRILNETDLEDAKTVIYLDEVAALGQRGLEGLLLKPIDESPCTWVASAISVTRPSIWKKSQRLPGLSIQMQGRFAIKVGTSLPGYQELSTWIHDRCRDWEITIDQPDKVVPLIAKRTGHRVGYVVHLLAAAASAGRRINPEMVIGFNFSPED